MRILHIALEGGPASFGGLGKVATQMLEAQNTFKLASEPAFVASIITPFYPCLYQNYDQKTLVAEVSHLYNYEYVTSKIYLLTYGPNKHYLIEPPEPYRHLFNILQLPELYYDTESSAFIERVKFFNSAVAAYLANPNLGSKHPQPQILQLHDWQAALTPKLLAELHQNHEIKSVFMVHIDNYDSGSFSCDSLQGIGLKLTNRTCILKAIGLLYAHKIVAVSPRFLEECITSSSAFPEQEYLRKIFTWASINNKTIGITNGIIYNNYCQVGKLLHDANNIYAEKLRCKHELAALLRGSRSEWQFNPDLPLILYVGRFSPEKGVDTFEQLIHAIAGRATFIAVGRSMTDDVYSAILNHSRQTDNVFITFSAAEQDKYINLMRAAADFVYIPSRREACGLVAPEGLANGAMCITTGVGGLKDVVSYANGIFFEVLPENHYNPDLDVAIERAIKLWNDLTPEQKNALQIRILTEAKQFDWQAPGGALQQYLEVFEELLNPVQQKIQHKPKNISFM